MKLVTVYKTFDSADAHVISSMLKAAEVNATVAHELSALSPLIGISVQVPEDEADLARELITTAAKPIAE
ncbi:MAG TPA: DUF2007 domain-containing protein [Verrucomicrobiae bacterium]|nr:DUF2007 domain-containing protein [Verrucomicrobiae bacterium]